MGYFLLATGSPSTSKKSSKHSAKGKHSKKRQREAPEPKGIFTRNTSRSVSPEAAANGGGGSGMPPSKRQKPETSTGSISEEEVRRYLMRRPITSKDLVKKFTSKKTEMDKNRIVEVLHKIIERLKNVEKKTVKGKLYLSLKNPPPP